MKEEPNYKMMLECHIGSLQIAYVAYRRAYARYLENTWINNDGVFCFSQSLLDNMKEKLNEYNDAMIKFENFKSDYAMELEELENVK